MEAPYFEEVFEEPINAFSTHLNNQFNERIVFSGKFGSGKTTFLKQYFSSDAKDLENSRYNAFHLFPVNYSIASNDDIIKYIKYDLIIQMLEKSTKIEDVDLKVIDSLPGFVSKNLNKIVATIVEMVPKVGKEVVDSWEKICDLIEEFKKHHAENNKKDGDILIKYLDGIQAEVGSIYENDIITKLISDNVKRGDKKSVLIIDDLDRVDPEHLFRILNVFAAHFDSKDAVITKNKFGFDKVILVCDAKNLKHIFHYKYGEEVDYAGYTDKFYSSRIFQFDNKKAVQNIVDNILKSISFAPLKNDFTNGELEEINKIYFEGNWVKSMIILLLDREIISLRSLLKIFGAKLNFHYEMLDLIGEGKHSSDYAWKTPFVVQTKILACFFGEKDHFLKCLHALSLSQPDFKDHEIFAPYLLYVAGSSNMARSDRNRRLLIGTSSFIVFPHLEFSTNRLKRVEIYADGGDDEKREPVRGDYYSATLDEYWRWTYLTAAKLIEIGYIY